MLGELFDGSRERDSKRSLTERERQILWLRAKKRCENPACRKKIDYIDMQVGHVIAWSKGGQTTIEKCKCLCTGCNKRQGTDSWKVFLKKQGVEDPQKTLQSNMKIVLNKLSVSQLKTLAKQHNVKIKGKAVEDIFSSYTKAPTKKQYVDQLSKIVNEKELGSFPIEAPKPQKKRKREVENPWF